MTRPTTLAFALALTVGVLDAGGTAHAQTPPKPPEQQEADRHFKNGVARFKEAKFAEALAEFERANEISPHPLVLYNIAGCYRELARYPEAVKFYLRFIAEGVDRVPQGRLSDAQIELDHIYALVARVTVKVGPADGASLFVDGAPAGALPIEAPLILPPGEHRLVARAPGRGEAERGVRVVAGDAIVVELNLPGGATGPTGPATGPQGSPGRGAGPGLGTTTSAPPPPAARSPRRFAVNAGFGTNALRAAEADTGTAAVGLGLALGSRLELGVDATLVAYSIIPSVRVRIAGEAIALHAVAAAPIAFNDGDQMQTFFAGGVGLGLRLRLPAMPSLALRLESYAAFASGGHGTTIPTFLGGELWF
jgi:hypothetical protein